MRRQKQRVEIRVGSEDDVQAAEYLAEIFSSQFGKRRKKNDRDTKIIRKFD